MAVDNAVRPAVDVERDVDLPNVVPSGEAGTSKLAATPSFVSVPAHL